MMKQSNALTIRMQSHDCNLSLSYGNITVVDSETQDSVCVQGVSADRVEREIRSYVRSKTWSHDENKRQTEIDWLAELIADAERSIASIREKLEAAEVKAS